MFFNRNPFTPKRIIFDAIKLDGTFRLLDKDLAIIKVAVEFNEPLCIIIKRIWHQHDSRRT
jgi:hypothetical protein